MADLNSYESRELSWQSYSRAGNQQMQEQQYLLAWQAYCQAIEVAELLLEAAALYPQYATAVHLYVVSHHNLADALLCLGEVRQAEEILRSAYAKVMTLMHDPTVFSELRLESLKALKMITFELHRFYRESEQFELAEALFTEATQAAQAFLAQPNLSQPNLSQPYANPSLN